jgi:hypothetical protein
MMNIFISENAYLNVINMFATNNYVFLFEIIDVRVFKYL